MCLATAIAAHAELPDDARAVLDKLPGKTITLDVVVGRSIEASDSFQAVKAQASAIDAPGLRGRAPLDLRLFGNAHRVLNRNEPQTPFNPNRLTENRYSGGVETYFQTGTGLRAQVAHGPTEIGFLSTPAFSYFETRGELAVSQNIWKDAFGYGTRRTARAGELLTEAAKHAFQESVEEWTTEIVQVFYGAWLAQARVRASETNVARRRRLSDITGIKSRRGTAESPDILQVKSALLHAQTLLAEAEQSLGDRWRGLVIQLKLPDSWIRIDPREIPITLDDPREPALGLCGAEGEAGRAPESTSTTKKLDLQAEGARLTAESARNAVAPEVKLTGSLVTNGIDRDSRSITVTETRQLAHPAWTVALDLSIPLFQYAERAAAHVAVADEERFSALSSDARGGLKLKWLNACQDLHRLEKSGALLAEAHESQLQRWRQEEERFRIGRTSTLAVIQSGDDATAAEWSLRQSEVERRLAAWRVRRLAGEYSAYLEGLKGGPTL